MLLVVALLPLGYTSTLCGTSWRVTLDVGLERGSWMPKNVEGWGASGTRLVVSTLVDFKEAPAQQGEELVGPQRQTQILTARGGGKIVTFEGEQAVTFESGGWCVQRPFGANADSDEGLLRFWLDCTTGCTKSDVSVLPGERIFFSTGTWDSAAGLEKLRADRAATEETLRTLEEAEAKGEPQDEDFWSNFPGVALRRGVARQQQLDLLRSRQSYFESWSGLDKGQVALMAKRGSMSLKRQRGSGMLARTVGTEYHILGTFKAEQLIAQAAAI